MFRPALRPLVPLLPVALASLVASCSVNPVTGESEITLMSRGQEIQLGAQSDEAIVAQYGVLENEPLSTYVEGIGQRMVPVSHRPDLPFYFRVLDDPVVNAFALPGGYVYVTRGILAYLNSEAALAGVLGHEIGHVTARHGVQRYTQQTLLGLGLGLGSVLSETFAEFAGLAGTAGQLLLLKYGRDDERQSDRLGVEYATKIGYDTADMASFFHTLERLSPEGGRLPSWMSTHPDPGERVGNVRELTQQWQAQTSGPYVEDRESYLRRIDGLVFGPDPREGFVRGGVFHHPQLRFRFPVPQGWKVQNGKSQVLIVASEQDAGIIFQGAPGTSASAAADAFLAQEGITPLDRDPVTVAGNSGVRTLARAATQGGDQIVISTWFGFGGGQWVFHGIATEAAFTARRAQLVSPADGFAAETDPAVLNVRPIRLQTVEAPHDGLFRDVVAGFPLPEGASIGDAEGLAVLNGMQVDASVPKGTLLKVLGR